MAAAARDRDARPGAGRSRMEEYLMLALKVMIALVVLHMVGWEMSQEPDLLLASTNLRHRLDGIKTTQAEVQGLVDARRGGGAAAAAAAAPEPPAAPAPPPPPSPPLPTPRRRADGAAAARGRGGAAARRRPVAGDALAKISEHVRAALAEAFRVPGAEFALLLEDDLRVAGDFFDLFAFAAVELRRDDSLWCASAWNDNAGPAAAGFDWRPGVLRRTTYFPGLGWMVGKATFERDFAAAWPAAPTTGWDHWIRAATRDGGRECLFPEVPRVRHAATGGSTNPRGFAKEGVLVLRRADDVTLYVADARKCAWLAPGERVDRPAAAVTAPARAAGVSCDEACAGRGLRCDARLLVFADACAALAAHFPCEAGCGHQLGVELPAYVTSKAEATAGQCLIANGGATPTCAAKHRATSLCVCVS
ncbi:alpha-1,3-mannosylglycoprotein 2-beta-N-acetylglucosaminyltransferase [Aureococcus anophagefferens]|nr:alpha-1,3-mannosylglycoprotein 2-beta-N-acetylglucosaminyltransferase [Aureococcus anophagefferens]